MKEKSALIVIITPYWFRWVMDFMGFFQFDVLTEKIVKLLQDGFFFFSFCIVIFKSPFSANFIVIKTFTSDVNHF